MTTPTHPTPTDEQVAKDFEFFESLIHTTPRFKKSIANVKQRLMATEAQNLQLVKSINFIADIVGQGASSAPLSVHVQKLKEQNLQLAAEVERCRELIAFILKTDEEAVVQLKKSFPTIDDPRGIEIKIMEKCRTLLSTPNPGKGLLEELKADSDRLMHIFKNPFNKDGFPWRTREEIDLAIDAARKGKEKS